MRLTILIDDEGGELTATVGVLDGAGYSQSTIDPRGNPEGGRKLHAVVMGIKELLGDGDCVVTSTPEDGADPIN